MSPSKTKTTTTAAVSSPPMNTSTEQNTPVVAPALPITTPNALLEIKDRRAFEHDRQRAHKPIDRFLSRHSRRPRHHVGNSGRSAKPFPGYRGSLRLWEGVISKEDMDASDERDHFSQDEDESRVVGDGHMAPLRVSLSDLIRPPHKRNGISQGFELIPRLRPVMIIEDSNESADEEDDILDWEMVRVPGTKREVSARQQMPKKSSYAAVLRASSIAKT